MSISWEFERTTKIPALTPNLLNFKKDPQVTHMHIQGEMYCYKGGYTKKASENSYLGKWAKTILVRHINSDSVFQSLFVIQGDGFKIITPKEESEPV